MNFTVQDLPNIYDQIKVKKTYKNLFIEEMTEEQIAYQITDTTNKVLAEVETYIKEGGKIFNNEVQLKPAEPKLIDIEIKDKKIKDLKIDKEEKLKFMNVNKMNASDFLKVLDEPGDENVDSSSQINSDYLEE